MKKVLIADDHTGVQQALRLALSMDGRMEPVGPVSSLADAIALSGEVDAVVLDLHLSDSEGAETVERFRAGAPDVPVIVYSATEKGEAEAAAAENGTVCIAKGEIRRLMDALAGLMALPARP